MGEAANLLPMHTDVIVASTWEQFILVPIDEDDNEVAVGQTGVSGKSREGRILKTSLLVGGRLIVAHRFIGAIADPF